MTRFSIRKIYKSPKWNGQTVVGLDNFQSLIDLRRKTDHRNPYKSCARSVSKLGVRVILNVSGTRFETFPSTLERYPNTLLGNPKRRAAFYDSSSGEYFFDRHRLCFESILYYYQSNGRLRRPDQVPLDTFLEEITYFDLGPDALAQVRKDEELEEVHKVLLPKNRFLRHLWANLEYPQYSLTSRILNTLSLICILISAFELAIETLPSIRQDKNKRCEFDGYGLMIETNSSQVLRTCAPNFHSSLFIVQSICIGYFTIEFLLRIISCPSMKDFLKSTLNWIDFLSIIPYYVILFINIFGFYEEISLRSYFALSLLRIFRFTRVCKLYRIFQHIKSLRVLACTLKETIPDFILLFSFLALSGFLFGAAMYFAENPDNPTVFDSIPKATYYGIVTLTAVGYGDMTPITTWGRFLACFAAIYGISTVSMLVSILVGRYQRVYNRKRFLNENYASELIRHDCSMSAAHTQANFDNLNEFVPVAGDIIEEENEDSNLKRNDISSSKVRFIIGYVSDDDPDDNDGSTGKLSSNSNLDEDDAQFVHKIAQQLLKTKLK